MTASEIIGEALPFRGCPVVDLLDKDDGAAANPYTVYACDHPNFRGPTDEESEDYGQVCKFVGYNDDSGITYVVQGACALAALGLADSHAADPNLDEYWAAKYPTVDNRVEIA